MYSFACELGPWCAKTVTLAHNPRRGSRYSTAPWNSAPSPQPKLGCARSSMCGSIKVRSPSWRAASSARLRLAGLSKSMPWVVDGRCLPSDYCFYGSDVIVARVELGLHAVVLSDRYRGSLAARDDYALVTGLGDGAFIAKGQLAVCRGTWVSSSTWGRHAGVVQWSGWRRSCSRKTPSAGSDSMMPTRRRSEP